VVGLLLVTVAITVARSTAPATASTAFVSTSRYALLPAAVTVSPSDYVPVLSTDVFMQQGETRRVSDQLETLIAFHSPEMDNRLICFDLTNFDPTNPYASEVIRTSAGTNYQNFGAPPVQWGVTLLLTAPRTATYRCRIEVQTSDGHANDYTMTVLAGTATDLTVGTWIQISNDNEVGAHQWATSYTCDPSDSTLSCTYIGPPQGYLSDQFLNPPPGDTWIARTDATTVEVAGTFQLTSCPSGSKSCRDGEHGDSDSAQVQTWLELDQLNPDGSICHATRTLGHAFSQYASSDFTITNAVHHFPISYILSASVSPNCNSSRQFKLDLHFAWKGGNPSKLDGGTFSVINSERSTTTTVPSVVGGTEAQAAAAIQAAGLTVTTSRVVAPYPPHTVLAQNSPSGTVEPTGSPVQITVSLGRVLVPYLIGLSRSAATREISNAGLTVGRISSVNNCVDPGSVLIQSPSQGDDVAVGSAVNLTVSTCTTTGSGGGSGGKPILPK